MRSVSELIFISSVRIPCWHSCLFVKWLRRISWSQTRRMSSSRFPKHAPSAVSIHSTRHWDHRVPTSFSVSNSVDIFLVSTYYKEMAGFVQMDRQVCRWLCITLIEEVLQKLQTYEKSSNNNNDEHCYFSLLPIMLSAYIETVSSNSCSKQECVLGIPIKFWNRNIQTWEGRFVSGINANFQIDRFSRWIDKHTHSDRQTDCL